MTDYNFINRHLSRSRRVRSALLNNLPGALGHPYNVTVSHKYRLIWYRVAKVGTRSLISLVSGADEDLIINYPKWRSLGAGSMESYTAISFVRNPYERLISAWKNKVVDDNLFRLDPQLHAELQDFEKFVTYISQYSLDNVDVHLRPQSRLMNTERVDQYGKMESFEADCQRIFGDLGFDVSPLSQKNASSAAKKPTMEYYSQKSLEQVNELYARDFEKFAYTKVDRHAHLSSI